MGCCEGRQAAPNQEKELQKNFLLSESSDEEFFASKERYTSNRRPQHP